MNNEWRVTRRPMKRFVAWQMAALIALSAGGWGIGHAQEPPWSMTAMTFQVGTLRSPRGEAEEMAFQRKVTHLKEIILCGPSGVGVDVVGLQGVEDMAAAEALVVAMNRALGPERASYVTWLVGESGAGDGPRVALLSKFPLTMFRNYFPTPSGPSILHGMLDLHGVPLHVIVNAWYRGTRGDADQMRRRQALWCRQLAEAVLKTTPAAHLLILGDFQSPPDSPLMRYLERGASADSPRLWRVSAGVAGGEPGTPRLTDHIFVSKALAGEGAASRTHVDEAKRCPREINLLAGEQRPAWAGCSSRAHFRP
jgi:endonuclease/exonuclease/phosphatase family metal-dependent hydrolase